MTITAFILSLLGLSAGNPVEAMNAWQADLPSNAGTGIGFTIDGKLFFGNCQVYDPILREFDRKRRYPKELCAPERIKFSTLSPDGSMLLSSVAGANPKCSGTSFRIDALSGRIRSRAPGHGFTNIAIHPNNRQFARIESQEIKASERTTGDPEQFQVVALRNLDQSLVSTSPSMGIAGIHSLQFIGDGSRIEIEGRVYKTIDWTTESDVDSPYLEHCSLDGSSCLRIYDGLTANIHTNRSARPISVPDLFHRLTENREVAWSQDGRFFAYKGVHKNDSGIDQALIGVVDLGQASQPSTSMVCGVLDPGNPNCRLSNTKFQKWNGFNLVSTGFEDGAAILGGFMDSLSVLWVHEKSSIDSPARVCDLPDSGMRIWAFPVRIQIPGSDAWGADEIIVRARGDSIGVLPHIPDSLSRTCKRVLEAR